MEKSIKVKVLGTRGSFFSHAEGKEVYGQETSCVFVRMGNTNIVLDFGSGITKLTGELLNEKTSSAEGMNNMGQNVIQNSNGNKVYGLLSHPHADHMIGLYGWIKLHDKDFEFDIYTAPKGGYSCQEQINQLFHPILWPIPIEKYPSKVRFHDIESSFYIEDVFVETLNVSHPGGSTIYKLTYDGKSVVYSCDIEYSKSCGKSFVEFVRNADLLLFDAYFTDENYIDGWGHSTFQEGVRITKEFNISQTVFLHHHFSAKDDEIRYLDNKLELESTNCRFAKDMMEIEL